MSQELTLSGGMAGRCSVTLTAKGKLKMKLDPVGWVECLDVLETWVRQVDGHTTEFDPLDAATMRWWQRLALLLELLGQGGQLETVAARTAAGAVPKEVTLTLTQLEALALLELSWALPPNRAQYSVWMGLLGDLHQTLIG